MRSGKIELFIRDAPGEKIVLTVAEENDLFGKLAMLDKGARTATAVAIEDSEVIGLDRDKLLLLFQRKPDAALDMIGAMGGMIRKADDILRTRVSRNVNEEVEERLTALERIADWIAWFSGSLYFLAMNTAWFVAWITINTFDVEFQRFDFYPYELLTMIVSLEAIFVLISQNRQAEKDRIRSNVEYAVNVKTELEIAHLHDKTDRLQEKTLEQFARLETLLAQARRE